MTFQASPLLSLLPLEIRLQIYSEVLSSHTIPLHLTNDGSALTTTPDYLAQKFLSLPLACHQISNETLPLLYTSNTYTLSTTTALRYFSRLPCHPLIWNVHFRFPLPHLPYFKNLPPTLAPSHSSLAPQTTENPKDPLQPQDVTWLETWTILTQMHGLKTLRIDLDVPIFWRRNWCEKEGEMLDWIDSSALHVPELVLGVSWDESDDGSGRRAKFGGRLGRGEGEGERMWRVEKWAREEENDLWQRDWGYLLDLSMSG